LILLFYVKLSRLDELKRIAQRSILFFLEKMKNRPLQSFSFTCC